MNPRIKKCFGKDETYLVTAIFPDDRFVDVMLCDVQYEEGEGNLPWTQAVLYEKNGVKICNTEPGKEFFGEWKLQAKDGKEYVVNVKKWED